MTVAGAAQAAIEAVQQLVPKLGRRTPQRPTHGRAPRLLSEREKRRANGAINNSDALLACANPDHKDLHPSTRAVKRVSGGRTR